MKVHKERSKCGRRKRRRGEGVADIALLFLKIERRNAGRLVSLEAGKDKEMDSP